MRIQYELTDERNKALENLMRETGITTKKELLNNALSLFEWAIQERKKGATLVSLDEHNNKYKEIIIPALNNIRIG